MNFRWPFTRKKNLVKQIKLAIQRGRVLGKFDAAQTTSENATHWSMTDALSADGGYTVDVRKRLRERARYEVGNNSYAKGMVLTLANDIIGTGPRLQIINEDKELTAKIETGFSEWSKAIGLAAKLRMMQMSKITDGEVFALLQNNPELGQEIQLDISPVEADRITSPIMPAQNMTNTVDGIIFDVSGNPKTYQLARQHPGDMGLWEEDFDKIPASKMIHYYRADRPGQTAAECAAVLHTKAPADGEAVEAEPWEVVELERRMATTLPAGWELGQIKAEQPTTSYPEFKKEILNEIARCLNIPFNVAAGNSAGYNYASGRLDHQTYFKSIQIEQAFMVLVILERIFKAWFDEALLTNKFEMLRNRGEIRHTWFFDGTEHVDPAKEATAQKIRLENGSTNLAIECAKKGLDWEEVKEQRAREIEKDKELGLVKETAPQENE